MIDLLRAKATSRVRRAKSGSWVDVVISCFVEAISIYVPDSNSRQVWFNISKQRARSSLATQETNEWMVISVTRRQTGHAQGREMCTYNLLCPPVKLGV